MEIYVIIYVVYADYDHIGTRKEKQEETQMEMRMTMMMRQKHNNQFPLTYIII